MEAKADTRNRLPLKNTEADILQCPSCDVKLSRFEVAQHCEQEMDSLRQMQLSAGADVELETVGTTDGATERRKPWTVFQRVQHNRQTRLKQRSRRRPAPPTEYSCPVCNLSYPHEEIQRHAEQCLRRSKSATTNGREEHSSNEEEDGDEYEEYEWAGQKRIRVSSLLQGGYASIGVGQTINQCQNGDQDEEEDLNVDEDDTHIYGPPQYGEGDVIPSSIEQNGDTAESNVTNYMRRLITGASSNILGAAATGGAYANIEPLPDAASPTNGDNKSCAASASGCTVTALSVLPIQHYQQIIDSLKAKLRHYENHVPSKFKCLICLDDYRNPAISVSCWHVHCEECWLRSLGARKLCPQCNLITTPKDLRRIYM